MILNLKNNNIMNTTTSLTTIVDDEEHIANTITSKLQSCYDDLNVYNVFEEIRKTNFKRLSFLSDILEDWDLSHLTGQVTLMKWVFFPLERDTDEIDMYVMLFDQLPNDKLIHFLAWAVASEELDAGVIDTICNNKSKFFKLKCNNSDDRESDPVHSDRSSS